MKRIYYLFVFTFFAILTISCSSNEEVLEGKKIAESNLPMASKSVSNYAADDFRIRFKFAVLKVPRRIKAIDSSTSIDCNFGLGFCVSISIEWNFQDPHLGGVEPMVLNSTGEVVAIYNIDEVSNVATFYLPEELVDLPQFTISDIEEFTVFEDLDMGNGTILKRGDYPLQYDDYGNLVYVIDTY